MNTLRQKMLKEATNFAKKEYRDITIIDENRGESILSKEIQEKEGYRWISIRNPDFDMGEFMDMVDEFRKRNKIIEGKFLND